MTRDRHQPMLIIVSAPSGAGKTTLCSRLLKDFAGKLQLSVSTTTRKARGEEREGVHYFFISADEFRERISRGDFAEWAQVHHNYYGTSKRTIEDAWKRGASVLLDIDVQGAKSLREAYPGRCFAVFVRPPSLDELRKRLEARGTDSPETIEVRMRNAVAEMARESEFDLVVVNNDLDEAYAELKRQVGQRIGGN